jgi:transcriptional regulator with XRE-family HTH domain
MPIRRLARMLAEVLYIGEKLRETRKRKLLTQEQLAERSGVGIATIVRIERNQVEPRGSTIRKLAEALSVDPHELVKPEE